MSEYCKNCFELAEKEVIAFLTRILEDKIFNTNQILAKAKGERNE